MADRGILFNPAMVQALLDGRKTQTRRVINPQPETLSEVTPLHGLAFQGMLTDENMAVFGPPNARGPVLIQNCVQVKLPFAFGDRLWVREAWRSDVIYDDLPPRDMSSDEPIIYEADGEAQTWGWPDFSAPGRYRPGMFMPRWASRLTLTVTDIRVQQIKDITERDAKAEGCRMRIGPAPFNNYRSGFELLWDSLNAERGFGWDANPWVSATTFTIEKRNIDQ